MTDVTDVIAAPRSPIEAAWWTELPPGVVPADVVAQLAAAVPERVGADYLVYERDGSWTLAIGTRASIELDRDECRISDDGPVVSRPRTGRSAAALAEALDTVLASIITADVGVSRVGADDDFFSLGGDSALATTVVARIRQRLDVSGVSVADIFATRTVAGSANRLRELEPAERLDEIAELYLEVAGMDTAEVAMAPTTAGERAALRLPG
ncbi:phosphopantetheine-binding protein [Mycolicibacterium helvum]|uniref:Carrier domain-containing protein n=1 Tax=Mycolicibacterium helvum TaxID=1534349 RepID=A0A7I7T5M6_9MYCO|nr:phosphopantetheine-binding protein [Mycolicibacterium helvum]BBY63555.1 hypothetical protein MHEL_17980 [Mycolicibacterium helvum]